MLIYCWWPAQAEVDGFFGSGCRRSHTRRHSQGSSQAWHVAQIYAYLISEVSHRYHNIYICYIILYIILYYIILYYISNYPNISHPLLWSSPQSIIHCGGFLLYHRLACRGARHTGRNRPEKIQILRLNLNMIKRVVDYCTFNGYIYIYMCIWGY